MNPLKKCLTGRGGWGMTCHFKAVQVITCFVLLTGYLLIPNALNCSAKSYRVQYSDLIASLSKFTNKISSHSAQTNLRFH